MSRRTWLPRVGAALVVAAAVGHAAVAGARGPARAIAWSSVVGAIAEGVEERASLEIAATPSGVARATTCAEGRERVVAILARDGASLTPDEAADATTLGSDLTSLRADDGSACVDAVLSTLRETTRCSRGYAAIVSGIVSSPRAPDDGIERLADDATPECGELVLRALGTGVHATPRLVAFAETSALGVTDPSRGSTAWLTLGSLGRLARARPDQSAIVAHVEDVIRTALVAANGDARVVMLEAAGNAACASCMGEIERDTRAARWDVRRAAVAALRFQSGSEVPHTICARLSGDASSGVREDAAWAMRWRDENDTERIECLITAAATDPARAVRKAATLSLIVLAERSSNARSALNHLTGDRYSEDVRRLATDYTMTVGAPVADVSGLSVDGPLYGE